MSDVKEVQKVRLISHGSLFTDLIVASNGIRRGNPLRQSNPRAATDRENGELPQSRFGTHHHRREEWKLLSMLFDDRSDVTGFRCC